jgi:16S rRNA (cytosine967-C5)-methyltransferase
LNRRTQTRLADATPPPSPRRAGADLVAAVLDERRSLDEALAHTESFRRLDGRDRAFARAIASATLRRLGGIDATLARFLAKPLPETAHLARALLRTGAAQALVLDTPAHAAVGETVALARADRKAAGFAGLINAVLRKVCGEGRAIFAALPAGADLPAWLFARWRATYGEAAVAIAEALRREPPLDLTLKRDALDGLAGAPFLGGLRLPPGSPTVEALPGYAEGAWWVQDAAAALPARLLGDVRGLRVLDLCAAPGGKTMQLAAAGAAVTALDIAAPRLARLAENLNRTRLSAEIVCADALTWSAPAPFDAVLLDAPCTATGTLRRHPDVAWLRRPGDVRSLAAVQAQLIAKAAELVKPGGMLVYAVCSLEPEEGPEIVAGALRSGAWRRAPIAAEEVAGAAQLITPDGDLRTLPCHFAAQGGVDGFYAARLIRA